MSETTDLLETAAPGGPKSRVLDVGLSLEPRADLVVMRAPDVVLAEAQKAARALKDVIDAKAEKVVFNGETYLEYEDWMTVGRFYGVTVKVESTSYVEYGEVKGFEARAVALRADGMVVSAAEAMCLTDEDKWRSRAKYEWADGKRYKVGEEPVPLFQLRSMAQTRACSKALRNVLAWVVVLAGYRPTPAEEMDGVTPAGKPGGNKATPKDDHAVISEAQAKRLWAIANGAGWGETELKEWLMVQYQIKSLRKVPKPQYAAICTAVEQGQEGKQQTF